METAQWVYNEGNACCCIFPPGSKDISEKYIHKKILPVYTKNFFPFKRFIVEKTFFVVQDAKNW